MKEQQQSKDPKTKKGVFGAAVAVVSEGIAAGIMKKTLANGKSCEIMALGITFTPDPPVTDPKP